MAETLNMPGEDQECVKKRKFSLAKKTVVYFAMGFLITFVGIMFVSQHYYDGRTVLNTNHWQYYWLNFSNMKKPLELIGPASSANPIFPVASIHLVCSLVSGVVFVGLHKLISRANRR
ncbi:MAG: hypothetical protein U0798_02755 [Gemmataceae bacterium]